MNLSPAEIDASVAIVLEKYKSLKHIYYNNEVWVCR